MRLAKIKLAGFKSFVDPTTLHLPSNLMGVVGPNGCGKSNVIDAVRWVMGESSAKHLRGESMADVIFSGSTARKPVGTASIELVFDNSDGAIGGQYAEYSDISVKRQVSRDGQSQYYLNGARCRRRDVTDVFLGTGLGPRSYSIIEQGMISRFIEAKPEELRSFIEEAAGISKYKDRRRETETRIRHTNDNLSRLNDLRDELEKQLQKLQRQSRTAEKYKLLKQEEQLLKAQLLALRWQTLHSTAHAEDQRIAELENRVESAIAGQREVENQIEQSRDQQADASESFNQVQARFYSVGADVARIQQNLQHGRERQEQLQGDLARGEQALSQVQGDLHNDRQQLDELIRSLSREEPALEQARAGEQSTREVLAGCEQVMQDWQQTWEQFNQDSTEPARAAEGERARIQQLEQQMDQARARGDRLGSERQSLDTAGFEQELGNLQQAQAEAEQERSQLEQSLASGREQIEQLRESIRNLSRTLQEDGVALQSQRGRLSSLEALQQQALGKDQDEVTEWLERRDLGREARLAQSLEVESGWEAAVETVLGYHLEAVCVQGLPIDASEEGLPAGRLGLFDLSATPATAQPALSGVPLLADRIRSPQHAGGLAASIYAVDSLAEAIALRERLGASESVVTREGAWVGANWMRLFREAADTEGVLAREHEIKQLSASIAALEQQIAAQRQSVEQAQQELKQREAQEQDQRNRLGQAHRRHSDAQSRVSALQARLEQVSNRIAAIHAELAELENQQDQGNHELKSARERLQENLDRMATIEEQRQSLSRQRDEYRSALDAARQGWQSARDQTHNVALKVESMRSRRGSLEDGMQRADRQTHDLEQRCQELRAAVRESEQPLQLAQQELDGKLGQRVSVEAELKQARSQVEGLDLQVRELEKQRHEAEDVVQQRREQLQQSRVARQSTEVRLQTVLENIQSSGFEVQSLLEGLEAGASEAAWQEQVEAMERRISRLGPINLAAIDEFEQQSERKEYLDAQHADLMEALNTLHTAIRKIDKETRTRFKETFDKINNGIKEIFPRLFGGGHAYLELTSDDMLETGITMMARPPGKRNSSIHLLSGGEKALTAVSMVFAIFELNPAPFCMLDEVDAPLDEANVGRFCKLVQSMSDRVQFVFITHNKATMEISNHLIGVTMNEPGVSRLVTVDVEEAVQMATA